jgi:peptide chain release factor 1
VLLDNEPGGHRIQRIPPTERKGRVHTSTVTVAVVDPSIKAVNFKDSDFKIEWYSGTGAGGQHRNKHQNSCRITHIPSGRVSTAQCRSRVNSLEEAKVNLIAELTQLEFRAGKASLDIERKNQVGSGMRGDKIRTYRFQDDVVKDHITEKSASVKQVLKGYFNLLW